MSDVPAVDHEKIESLRHLWQFCSDERGLTGIKLLDTLEALDEQVTVLQRDVDYWRERCLRSQAQYRFYKRYGRDPRDDAELKAEVEWVLELTQNLSEDQQK